MAGRRLDQVDAMRPVKQAGVIGTHVVLYFAPAGRRGQPWSTLIPRRSAPGLPAPGPGPDPAPATVAGVTSDQNGAR